MLLSWLIDIMIGHWEIQQCQRSNAKMIGWPSIERYNDTKVEFDSLWYDEKTMRDTQMPSIEW